MLFKLEARNKVILSLQFPLSFDHMNKTTTKDIELQLKSILSKRIMIMDGAMGTMIQQYHLSEDDYRGDGFVTFSAPEGETRIIRKR